MSDYSDINDHPHHRSATHPHMSMTNRAAQFSPFAALTGFDEAIEEVQEDVSKASVCGIIQEEPNLEEGTGWNYNE